MTARRAPAAASARTPATTAGGASAKKTGAVEGAKPDGEPLVWPSRQQRRVSKGTSLFILEHPNPESDSIAGIAGRITHKCRALNEHTSVQNKLNSEPVDLAAFLKAQARQHTIKELARLTGVDPRTVERLRMNGGASGKAITNWCQRDDVFRRAYFYHCGGILEGRPELLRGLTMAVQSVLSEMDRE